MGAHMPSFFLPASKGNGGSNGRWQLFQTAIKTKGCPKRAPLCNSISNVYCLCFLYHTINHTTAIEVQAPPRAYATG